MDNNTKNSYVFILGREREIALAELKAVLGRFGICFDIYKITGNAVFANIDNFTEDDATKVMDALAGTIKIFQISGPMEKDLATQIARVFEEKKRDSDGKINFGLSYYGKGFTRQNINSIALTAKKKLKGKFSLRYVESRDSFELSTILTLKNNLLGKGIEFGLFDNVLGVLIAFNNPEEWNKRDYGKPASDKYSGMVPPKLARMMVNLALGECKEITKSKLQISNKISNDKLSNVQMNEKCDDYVVVDPFCGSGNILMEAMMLGCDVVGSDVSEKAALDTQKNLDWLAEEYQVSGIKYQVFQTDATEYDFKKICSNDQIAVVAEPFLGEPKKYKPTRNAAYGEYEKIKELYLKFLKNIRQLQSEENKLVFCLIFPLVETSGGRRYSLYNESVDEIKKLGYTQACNSYIYGRDYQVVKREIVLLQLKQKDTSYKKQ